MFIGHYGPSFAGKVAKPAIPLWVLFLAVQLVDIAWSILVLLGIEKLRIVPGFTATNPLDLYYMPFTHSLPGAALWSVGAALVYRAIWRTQGWPASAIVGAAVFSHWILDLVVHRPISRCTTTPIRSDLDFGIILQSLSHSRSRSCSAGLRFISGQQDPKMKSAASACSSSTSSTSAYRLTSFLFPRRFRTRRWRSPRSGFISYSPPSSIGWKESAARHSPRRNCRPSRPSKAAP